MENNAILIIVDKYIKWRYFIVCIEGITAKDLARIYTREIFVRHGLLVKIISDRDLNRVRILGNLYSRIRNLYSNINSILSIDR